MFRESFLPILQLFIALASLVKNDIYHFIMLANILRGQWHELIDNLAEEVDVSSSVVTDAGYEFSFDTLMLQGR